MRIHTRMVQGAMLIGALVVLSACATSTPATAPLQQPTEAVMTEAPTAVPTATSTPVPSHPLSLHYVEHADTDTVQHIGPASEKDSLGDVLAFSNPVYDAKNTSLVGQDNGLCVRTVVGAAWECIWTLTVSGSSITVEGPFYDTKDSTLAVTGGTGFYASVTGDMALHARNDKGTEYDFIYNLDQNDRTAIDSAAKVTYVERATTDTVQHIGPASEKDSLGDVLGFGNKVYDAGNATEVGSDNGMCVRTAVGVSWECIWTLTLKDGQLVVEGPFLDAGDSTLAIIGGTGAYSSARGQMILHSRNAQGSEYDFTYQVVNAAASSTTKTTYVEHADTDTVRHIGPASETDSVGDVLAFGNNVFDDKNATQVGSDNGLCVRTAVGAAWECIWTLSLSDGQLVVEGPFFDAADSTLAVIGGTGPYKAASGQMTLHARNDKGTEYDFAYDFAK